MAKGLSRKQENNLLDFFLEITALTELADLLKTIVEKTPQLLEVGRCSIYLTREFVPQCGAKLITGEWGEIYARRIKEPFIVLAQTNYEERIPYIGKIFYTAGQELTGWVFQHGKTLRMEDSWSLEEVRRIDPSLNLPQNYTSPHRIGEARERKRPILYVPLQSASGVIGVLKLHEPHRSDHFDEEDEGIATIIAQLVTGVVQKAQFMDEQSKIIVNLTEMTSVHEPAEAFKKILETLERLLACPKCQLYIQDDTGARVELFPPEEPDTSASAVTPDDENRPKNRVYQRGEGLIGWVYKTGRPLIVDDLHMFLDDVSLDEASLEKMSDDGKINEIDRRLHVSHQNKLLIEEIGHPIPFMAVPVKIYDGTVRGVLCAHFLTKNPRVRVRQPFTRTELRLLENFANTTALAIYNDLLRRKNDLLLDVSLSTDLKQLYDLIVKNISFRIPASYGFIFRAARRSGEQMLEIVASKSNREEMTYAIGDGKTGFCALAGKPLVISHFGSGEADREKIQKRKARITERRARYRDLVADYRTDTGEVVGIIQLWGGEDSSPEIQEKFFEMARTQFICAEDGLSSEKMDTYRKMGVEPSRSFLAVPVQQKGGELDGVITLSRRIPQNPFAPEDVLFVLSLANTLASVIDKLTLHAKRSELLETLAHEIHTPLTGLLADTENLAGLVTSPAEMKTVSQHVFTQSQYLQMLTETIMTYNEERLPQAHLKPGSLYKLISRSIEIFREEARLKGCDILAPVIADGSHWPDIPMSEFELGIAIKNILHNAIKYSFHPPADRQENRYIRITGRYGGINRNSFTLAIQNYGVGITPAEIQEGLIFQPHYRGENASDQRRTGVGFGLYYSRRVIEEMHHGKIRVESIPMGGRAHLTTFYITLPLRQAD